MDNALTNPKLREKERQELARQMEEFEKNNEIIKCEKQSGFSSIDELREADKDVLGKYLSEVFSAASAGLTRDGRNAKGMKHRNWERNYQARFK